MRFLFNSLKYGGSGVIILIPWVSYSDVNAMAIRQAEDAESCENYDILLKYDHNIFDLFSSHYTPHFSCAPWEDSDWVRVKSVARVCKPESLAPWYEILN